MGNNVQSYGENRHIIVHNHLFKNAGSSIDWALRRNFYKGFIDHRDNESMKDQDVYLPRFFHNHRSIKAFSTHHLRLPLPDVESVDFTIIMMFRHPVERVLSVYKFERGQKHSKTQGAVYAREHAMREYVEWRLRSEVPPSIRNFHVGRCLPRRNYNRFPLTQEDIIKAKKILHDDIVFGIVDMFDESMVVLEHELKGVFPEIDLSYVRQNVNPGNAQCFDVKLDELKKRLGVAVMQALNDHNRDDLDLYAYARALLLDKISEIGNFDSLLNKFRRRCQLKRI